MYLGRKKVFAIYSIFNPNYNIAFMHKTLSVKKISKCLCMIFFSKS